MKILFYILLVLTAASNLYASYLSDILNRIKSFTFCQIPLYTAIPGMAESCAEKNPDGKLDLVPIITGRMILRLNLGLGCF